MRHADFTTRFVIIFSPNQKSNPIFASAAVSYTINNQSLPASLGPAIDAKRIIVIKIMQ
jgi:hypothetical protein